MTHQHPLDRILTLQRIALAMGGALAPGLANQLLTEGLLADDRYGAQWNLLTSFRV
jgi:hypothetical protein